MKTKSMHYAFWAIPVLLLASRCGLANADWLDAFYPYRVPIVVDVSAPGEYQLDLAPETVTAWINEKADFRFDPKFFGCDNVRLVEIDSQRRIVNRDVDAGYRIRIGRELIVNGNFETQENGKPVGWQIGHQAFALKKDSYDQSWCMTTEGADRNGCVQSIPTEANRWYYFSCRARGPAAVNAHYFPKGNWWRVIPHTYRDPYIPAEGWYQVAYYFNTWDKAGWETDQVQVRMERFTGAADEISVRECQVAFVLKADKPGTKRYLLYYSPIEGNTSTVPSGPIQAIPDSSFPVRRAGETEYLDDGLSCSLLSNAFCDLWYSSTMKKVFDHDPPPKSMRQKISFSAARNESEAIQLVLRPKCDGQIKAVSARLTGPRDYVMPSECFDIRQAKYVTIQTPSRTGAGYRDVCRSAFTGRLPDPLPKFAPVASKAGDRNIIIWVDAKVPKDAPAGLYQGELGIDTSSGHVSVAWELRVWDFTLPDRPTCRTAFQFTRYANQFLFPFHKVGTDKQERYDLSRAYIAEMARYKISARSPHSAGVWDPDKETLGPFGSEEKELSWALDKLHVSGCGVGHFSGPSLGEQTVESATAVAERYDDMAAMLKRKGWLKYAYIQIDEPQPRHYQGLRNWIGAFRRQPHAKDIPMFAFVYAGQCYDTLSDCVDILVPENNDGGNVVSPAAIARWPKDKQVWCYWTNTAHQWIDSPNINARLWSPKVWWMGAQGMATWGITLWWKERDSLDIDNPWVNPLTPWGNGVLAYFYPPNPKGSELPKRDFSIVPSLRMVLTRDGIEDYEYAVTLEKLLATRKASDAGVAEGKEALAKMRRQFRSPVTWTLGEVHWQQTRCSAARAIELLNSAEPSG